MIFGRHTKVFFLLICGLLTITSNHVQAKGSDPKISQYQNAPSLVADIYPGASGSGPHYFAELNGKLYFVADSASGRDIWVYDAAQQVSGSNPTVILDFGSGFTPYDILPVNGKLYLKVQESSGLRLWVFDPLQSVTESNPVPIEAFESGSGLEYYSPYLIKAIDNKIYFAFSGWDYESFHTLWVFDTEQPNVIGSNPKILFQLRVTSGIYQIADLVPLGGYFYFTHYDSRYGREIWQYDPLSETTDQNPKLLFEMIPGNVSDSVDYLMSYNDKLFFQASDGVNGNELWVFDPASAIGSGNPDMVADIYPGSSGSAPIMMKEINGVIFFKANDGTHGQEYWIYDPSQPVGEDNPKMIGDINEGSGSGTAIVSVIGVAITNHTIMFTANDGSTGNELWEYDLDQPSNEFNPALLMDINPASTGFGPNGYYTSNGFVYFNADNGQIGSELWRLELIQLDSIDPTGNFITPINGGTISKPRAILSVNASDSGSGVETVTFLIYYGGSWHTIGEGEQNGNVWSYQLPTYDISNQTVSIQAEIQDFAGNSKTILVENIRLSTSIEFGNGYETRGGGEQIISSNRKDYENNLKNFIREDQPFRGNFKYNRKILVL